MALPSRNLARDRESTLEHGSVYRFGQFVLDSRKRTLSRADSPVVLTPKAFDVLTFLVRNPNRLVTKQELMQAVWGETFVEEGNLTQYISHLRKALGDSSDEARLIVTIARKGYQFTADVTVGAAVDGPRLAALQIPTEEASQPESPRLFEFPAREAAPNAASSRRKTAIMSVSILLLAVVVFSSWRHFWGVAPSRSPRIMLAVLPFENLTGDPNKEYLADGLTEQTISQLGRLNPEQLGVIARTSVMGYKHTDKRLDQIGHDLSVQYVLENSLRESGNQIRLTAQLIQVKDQTHLWSKDYDYPAEDILKVQDDVARAVAQEIKLRLAPQQREGLAQANTVNPEAFDAYLQGYYFFERNTDKDTEMAARYYERATQLDPSYALAWVGLSRVRKWQAASGLIPAEAGYRLAREAVEKALSLNPNLAEAHNQMGRIQQQVDFDWAGADASFKRAVELEPANPESLQMAASVAVYLGQFDNALPLSRRAVDLDPLNAGSWEDLGETKFYMGRPDQAVGDFRKAIELNPDLWNGHIYLSQAYITQGRAQDALPEIERVRLNDARVSLHAIAYYALGRKKESDAALGELIAKYPRDVYLIAEVYAFRDQSDAAFQWLDRAYATHDSGLIEMKVDPLLKNLRSDPRYATLLTKLNLPN